MRTARPEDRASPTEAKTSQAATGSRVVRMGPGDRIRSQALLAARLPTSDLVRRALLFGGG